MARHGGEKPTRKAARPSEFRERHREARRREFLEVARELVVTEGLGALTMQRVTQELSTSSGGIYLYFKNREALVSELQTDAVTTLGASYTRGQGALAEALADLRATPINAALTHVIATGRFWIDAEQTLPVDLDLFRRLFSNPDVEVADHTPALSPAVLEALEEGRQRLDRASALGAIDGGDNLHRMMLLTTSVSSALLTSRVGPANGTPFDGRSLATQLVQTLVKGWGAQPKRIEQAEAYLAKLAKKIQLAPPIAS